jgi:hypothetical protein
MEAELLVNGIPKLELGNEVKSEKSSVGNKFIL